jgi:hypothetical protein
VPTAEWEAEHGLELSDTPGPQGGRLAVPRDCV